MNPKQLVDAEVDGQGRLVLPPEVAKAFGLKPGIKVQVEHGTNEFHVLRPISQLAKVYLEVTSDCNLGCSTCVRNAWNEILGSMTAKTFKRVLAGLAEISPRPRVFFGGFGEPLSHPMISEMVRQVKELGCETAMITNGILLTEKIALQLIRAGLDMLWVSIDGATPESYADIRLGASLPTVIENLRRLRTIRYKAGYQHDHKPQLGIAFVAMKQNIADLPEVLRLGASLGAKQFSVSNVLAHTNEMQDQALYQRQTANHATWRDSQQAIVNLPRIDTNPLTQIPLSEIQARKYVFQLAGKPTNRSLDTCQFIEQGSTAIRWDGKLVPCLPLLHSHESYLTGSLRQAHSYEVGNIHDTSLLELWETAEYGRFRERVRYFDFSPCVSCVNCEFAEENVEDCLGSPFPTCGGCLWGQGLIQCP
jgi:MoaA/NifB/PqqE/SkfB family radical SAM enzyme